MKSTVSHKEDGKLQNGVGKEVVLSDREKQVRTTSPFAADFVNEHGREVVNGSLPQMDIQNMESHLNTIRSRFLTTAAHEFRTPLSTILSSAELAEKYLSVGDTNRLEAHLGKIKLAALQITGILNDFLSLSKLEEGKISFGQRPTPEPRDYTSLNFKIESSNQPIAFELLTEIRGKVSERLEISAFGKAVFRNSKYLNNQFSFS